MFGNSIKDALVAATRENPSFKVRNVKAGMCAKAHPTHSPKTIVTRQRTAYNKHHELILVRAPERVQKIKYQNPFTGKIVTVSGDIW